MNGKNNYKENGWSRGSSPWLLDEPANFQDYWALRWFAAAFHEGVQQVAVTTGFPVLLYGSMTLPSPLPYQAPQALLGSSADLWFSS